MKTLMNLGGSILQLPAIKTAKKLGLNVVVVDMNPNAIGFKEENIIKEVISTIDIPKVISAAKRNKIDGIMTLATDMPMRTIAAVTTELNLPGIDEETAFKATNKFAMREALKTNNVPIPLYYKVNNFVDYKKSINKIIEKGYQCISKPVDSSGSRGIFLINELIDCELKKAFDYSMKYSNSGEVLVEEYMIGNEISVETISVNSVCNVIQITDKITTGAPYFVEMGHCQPSSLDDSIKDQIRKIAIAANNAIGIKNGPAHIEMKITKDGPKIVELGARLGGDNINTHLVPLSTGVDMVLNCINIALGLPVDIDIKFNKYSKILYLESHKGILKRISNLDKARKIPGVKDIEIVKNINDQINDIKSSGDRIGFVISQGNTKEEANIACQKAIDMIGVDISNDL